MLKPSQSLEFGTSQTVLELTESADSNKPCRKCGKVHPNKTIEIVDAFAKFFKPKASPSSSDSGRLCQSPRIYDLALTSDVPELSTPRAPQISRNDSSQHSASKQTRQIRQNSDYSRKVPNRLSKKSATFNLRTAKRKGHSLQHNPLQRAQILNSKSDHDNRKSKTTFVANSRPTGDSMSEPKLGDMVCPECELEVFPWSDKRHICECHYRLCQNCGQHLPVETIESHRRWVECGWSDGLIHRQCVAGVKSGYSSTQSSETPSRYASRDIGGQNRPKGKPSRMLSNQSNARRKSTFSRVG